MQLAKKAGGVALKLSQSHSQIAVTLSKSELKKLIPTAPGGAQSERAHTCSVLRGRATVFGQPLSASGSEGRRSFLQIDNWG